MATKADYPGGVLAACCGSTLHLWRPKAVMEGEDKAVASDRAVGAAAWNRNNKVVAVAREDGAIDLRYSNGTLMTALPRGGPPPGARPVTSLSWSMGSKRLAAGSQDGSVYIHDMTAKTCTPIAPSGSSFPVVAVAFHPEDRFLAIASRRLALHSVQTLSALGELTVDSANSTAAASSFTCLAVPAASAALAAGTAGGCVAVWDSKTAQTLHADASRHVGGTAAVAFAPLDPSILYSAGVDGAILMQDLREGPFHVPTARIGAGSGLSSLAIREDFSFFAAGTVDGRVLLYDPRNVAAPASTLRCGEPAPVSCLHWQHHYQSLGGKTREALAAGIDGRAAAATGRMSLGEAAREASATPPPPRASRLSLASHLEPPRKLDLTPAAAPRPAHANGNDDGSNAAAAGSSVPAVLERLRRQSMAAEREGVASGRSSAPPNKPVAAAATTFALGGGMSSVVATAFPTAAGAPAAAATAATPPTEGASTPSPSSSSAVSIDEARQRFEEKEREREAERQRQQRFEELTAERRRMTARLSSPQQRMNSLNSPQQQQQGSPLSVRPSSASAAREETSPSATQPWSIKAATPAGRGRYAAPQQQQQQQHQQSLDHLRPSTLDHPSPDAAPAAGAVAHHSSPSKAAYLQRSSANGEAAGAAAAPPIEKSRSAAVPLPMKAQASSSSQEESATADQGALAQGLHHDILALHLDMLNQFREQQEATAALVAGVIQRQEALSEEVSALRHELRDLLSRRDGTLWL